MISYSCALWIPVEQDNKAYQFTMRQQSNSFWNCRCFLVRKNILEGLAKNFAVFCERWKKFEVSIKNKKQQRSEIIP